MLLDLWWQKWQSSLMRTNLFLCLEERINDLLDETKVYFLVDTLKYLQKNGRIGKAQAMVGSLLKVKPILSLSPEGEVYPFDKARGPKKAISRIIEAVKSDYGDSPIHIGASHALNEELADELIAEYKLNVRFNPLLLHL